MKYLPNIVILRMKVTLKLSLFLCIVFLEQSVFSQPFSLVKDINSGNANSLPDWLINFDGILYFTANNGIHGKELWKSDGTEAGTVMVKDISPGTGDFQISSPIAANGGLYFVVNDGIYGEELWWTDGTEIGTKLVKDIWPGSSNGAPAFLNVINGILYFSANNGVNGFELWKSDGTEAGTVMIKDINPGPASSRFFYTLTTEYNGMIFFNADDGINGDELWKTDGTEYGTSLVKDINPGSDNSFFSQLGITNGLLLFLAETSFGSAELWKTDGTTVGTSLVKDIYPGSASSSIMGYGNLNSYIYFSANDGINGRELWRTDGTTGGTVQVIDLYPGIGSGFPNNYSGGVVTNGKLYFSGTNGSNGFEIWKTNGTSPGTSFVQDIETGPGDCNAYFYTVSGNRLFCVTQTTSYGWELWSSPLASLLPLRVIDFVAYPISEAIQLEWILSNNDNIDFFEIERSFDGRDYDVISKEPASKLNKYKLRDNDPSLKRNKYVYYRIRQVDKNGAQFYSKIVKLETTSINQKDYWISNPVYNEVSINLYLQNKTTLSVNLFNELGVCVLKNQIKASSGKQKFTISLKQLPQGIYFLNINNPGLKNITHKLIKL